MSLLKKMARFALFVPALFVSQSIFAQTPVTIDKEAYTLAQFAELAADAEIAKTLLDLKQAATDVQIAAEQKTLTKKQAEAVFSLIDESLGQIVLAKGKKTFRGGRDSDHDCDECVRLIRKIREFLKCCCESLHEDIEELKGFIEYEFPCNAPIAICTVPYTIYEPGHYCVVNDLIYNDTDIAIFIDASDVYIDFNGNSLILNPNAIGIFAESEANIFIKNGTIQAMAPSTNSSCWGIGLFDVIHGRIDNMTIASTFVGVNFGYYDLTSFDNVPGVADFTVSNCYFNLPSPLSTTSSTYVSPVAIQAANSQGITVDRTVFGQIGQNCASVAGFGFLGVTNCKNTTITNCQFLNSNGSDAEGIVIQGSQFRPNDATSECAYISDCSFYNSYKDIVFTTCSNGPVDAVVRNCTSGNTRAAVECEGQGLYVENYVASQKQSATSYQLVLLGLGPQTISGAIFNPVSFACLDATFKNCIFTASEQLASGTLFNAQAVDGLLIDGCVFDSNGSGDPALPQFPASQIAIGRDAFNANNVKITNCVLRGNAQYGIVATNTGDVSNDHVIIQDCLIDGSLEAGIYLDNTLSAYVDACSISNVTGHGIAMTDTTIYNTVKNCTVSENSGIGIFVNEGSDYHYITDNKAYNNAVGIQIPAGTHSQLYRNEACNNFISDCIGISANLVGTPGSTVFQLGQNICCNSY